MAKVVRTARPCVFCGSTAKLTREHVWGEWLRQIVPAEMRKHHVRTERIGLPGTTNDAQTILRAGDPLSSKVKVVCARCNNGWLSQIQQRAKPHLIPLIKGGRSALNPDAQRAVATWCAMATMTGEYLDRDPGSVGVPQADRKHLMDNQRPPPGWKIWIGRYVRHRWPGRWIHFTVPILERRDVTGNLNDRFQDPNTQVTTFVVGELLVHTMSSADQAIVDRWEWPLGSRLRRLTTRVSPASEILVAWPPDSLSDDDANVMSRSFEWVIDGASRSMSGRRLF